MLLLSCGCVVVYVLLQTTHDVGVYVVVCMYVCMMWVCRVVVVFIRVYHSCSLCVCACCVYDTFIMCVCCV